MRSQSISNSDVVMDTNPISITLYNNQPNFPTTHTVSAPVIQNYQCIGIECPFVREYIISGEDVTFTFNNKLLYIDVDNMRSS